MPVQQQLPLEFGESYERCNTYPQNLIYKASYRGVLKSYESRFETPEPRPFLTQALNDVDIHFRDWDNQNSRFVNYNFTSEDMLRKHLGEHAHIVPLTGKPVWTLLPKVDPKCRFIFLYAELSTKPLKTTPNILKRLLTFHQVMPVFIDFLTVFAHPPQQRELGFSGFFDQITLSNKFHSTNVAIPAQQPLLANTRQPIVSNLHVPRGPAATSLGRSGRQYQLCYNLKRVARTKGTARDEYSDQTWSVQQSAFHHQFDVEEGTTLWMNAKGRLDDYREQVMELTGDATGQPEELFFKTPEDCFRSSLTVHLMNCHWATHDWRGYINYLEAAIEEQTRHIVVGPWLNEEFTPASLQALQRSEEKATNAIMILEANMEVLTGLKKFFEKLTLNKDFDMRDQSAEAITAFVQQISDMIHAFAGHKRRATLLVNITENRKNLLLQRLQSQATKKMEDLTTMSYRETVGMRIITVGTFVFLPATFVSTFFSTDIIKYQNTEDGKGNFSSIALERWLEVTLPLTAATLFFGFISFLLVDRRRKKRMESWLDEKTKEP